MGKDVTGKWQLPEAVVNRRSYSNSRKKIIIIKSNPNKTGKQVEALLFTEHKYI